MTDYDYLVNKANELLLKNKYTRFGLAKRIGCSKETLDKLAKQGLIKNYPEALTPSQAATYGRKVGGDAWGRQFKLRGSPSYEGVASRTTTVD